ncbi:MAG: MarR family transcriptional regulator [Pseudomonadota bacterium]
MAISPAEAICQFVPPFMRFLRDGLAELNMTPARFQILQALNQGNGISMNELADRLSVTKRNVTTLVDGLEKEGLAIRKPHPTDRRSTLVSSTPDGKALFQKAADIQQQHLRGLMETLDETQQVEMTKALITLTAVLSTKG